MRCIDSEKDLTREAVREEGEREKKSDMHIERERERERESHTE